MNSSKTYKWIVVGAGPHGVHLVSSLLRQGVARSKIALLDRHPEPLFLWKQQTARLAMSHLRSPAVHHLGKSPWSLIDFAQERFGHRRNWSASPYQRPSYKVFQAHCDFVLEEQSIPEIFIPCEVQTIKRGSSGTLTLKTDQGTLHAEHVVLSVGQASPRVPEWALGNPLIQHLLSAEWKKVKGRVAIVGAGMTACQFCLAHHKKFESTHLIAPKWPDVSDFDADPCWLGPKCLNESFMNATAQAKRQQIHIARRQGSINQTVCHQLQAAIDSGSVIFHTARVVSAEGAKIRLDSGECLTFDHVILGTGFEKKRPGGQLVDDLIDELDLPVGPCGYPQLSQHLEWTRGLYVTGGLAELSLGPVSRNISGGRKATKLILESITSNKSRDENSTMRSLV